MVKTKANKTTGEFISHLFDEKSFYSSFLSDLGNCQREVIIESPFISTRRMKKMMFIFRMLVNRGVAVYVITKDPSILDYPLSYKSEKVIREFEDMGVKVFVTSNNHHRKLAILDRQILWEGSLNILSQIDSREIMRRIEGEEHAKEMFDFLKLERFIN